VSSDSSLSDDNSAVGSGAAQSSAAASGFKGAVSSRLPLQLRFSDTDKLGHINNAVYATYAEVGRLTFLREIGVEVATVILARLAIDFRRQVRLGEDCVIESRVVGIGNSSFELKQTLYANDELAAEFQAVMVWFDYQRQTPAPIPAAVRRLLRGDQGDPG